MIKRLKILLIAAVLGIAVLAMTQAGSSGDKPVASLDGQEIDVRTLTVYLDEVLGDGYSDLLDSETGLKTLADYYINRVLLLAYAKENIDDKNPIMANHGPRGSDEDTMYLTALLKQEVQDKVKVDENELDQLMKSEPELSRPAAVARVEQGQRAEYTKQLIEFVRSGHKIEYFL